jgi:hypothetical protein
VTCAESFGDVAELEEERLPFHLHCLTMMVTCRKLGFVVSDARASLPELDYLLGIRQSGIEHDSKSR